MTPGKNKNYSLLVFILILAASIMYLFYLDLRSSTKDLTFAMLDIGQGDGLFIQSPTGTQIMFDAGPAHSVLGPLSRVMSPFDKSIDAIVITNPDADHIGGFLDILKNYKVGRVFEPGTFNDSKTYQNLEAEIKRQNIPDILVERGMRLNIGGGAVIDILFPDRDVSLWTSNDGSVVAKLFYGKTSVMLTGDATALTEKIVLSENSATQVQSTILKVGHHGSRTSTSRELVQAVAPTYAMISDGRNNKYGHPHQETLDTLVSFGAKILRTDLLGTIVMKSDGQKETFSFNK
ncbi:MAG TPA: ComEC/Rec2 family competence protein [Candidatus Paceibacterota bacterium]|jgi:competence protein ComEC|nr:ComEC/Rec2 family competence protein [Candidatus Paceibacterota bacterium]